MILGLADGEGYLTIGPVDDGGEVNIVSKDFVGGDPALQLFERRGGHELDGLAGGRQ